jgi:hypothetical protein
MIKPLKNRRTVYVVLAVGVALGGWWISTNNQSETPKSTVNYRLLSSRAIQKTPKINPVLEKSVLVDSVINEIVTLKPIKDNSIDDFTAELSASDAQKPIKDNFIDDFTAELSASNVPKSIDDLLDPIYLDNGEVFDIDLTEVISSELGKLIEFSIGSEKFTGELSEKRNSKLGNFVFTIKLEKGYLFAMKGKNILRGNIYTGSGKYWIESYNNKGFALSDEDYHYLKGIKPEYYLH